MYLSSDAVTDRTLKNTARAPILAIVYSETNTSSMINQRAVVFGIYSDIRNIEFHERVSGIFQCRRKNLSVSIEVRDAAKGSWRPLRSNSAFSRR